MEISYKKDGNRNFLMIGCEEFNEADYKFQMLTHNKVKALLPVKVKMTDNKYQLYYEITAMSSLRTLCNKKLMGHNEFVELIRGIETMTDSLGEFLLEAKNVLFNPEYIFRKHQSNQYYFCYYPIAKLEHEDGIRNLFDQLLEFVDHNDKIAVEIAYGIERITMSDDYSIQELMEYAMGKLKQKETLEQQINTFPKNIFEIPEKEKNFFQKFLGKLKKNHYWTKDQLESNVNPSGESLEEITDTQEEATVFLTMANPKSITLKSVDLDTPIVIRASVWPCILGKSRQSSDYVIESPVISRVHMRLSADQNGYYIEDLNSTNGTYRNGIRLLAHKQEIIEDGDKIKLADIEFICCIK